MFPALNLKDLVNSNDPVWHVELTPEEINKIVGEAIYKAKLTKYETEQAELRRQRAIRAEQEILRPWTAEDLFAFVQHRVIAFEKFSENEGKDGRKVFQIDEHNEWFIKLLCYYFTNDERFEQIGRERGEEWSLQKGLLVYGDPGVGKSVIMRLFTRNKRQCYDIITCENCCAQYALHGQIAIDRYATVRYTTIRDAQVFYQQMVGICFEDLGTEDESNHFGNKKNVMEKIFLQAYERREYPNYIRHATTNLSADEIEAKYGRRVRSRFREIFNTIELAGPDRRR